MEGWGEGGGRPWAGRGSLFRGGVMRRVSVSWSAVRGSPVQLMVGFFSLPLLTEVCEGVWGGGGGGGGGDREDLGHCLVCGANGYQHRHTHFF